MSNTIGYEGCSAQSTLVVKVEHDDETTDSYKATEWDLWRAGYVSRALVEKFISRIVAAPCACLGDEHERACAISIALGLEEALMDEPEQPSTSL